MRLCQRRLDPKRQTDIAQWPPRERSLLRERLESGLWALLAGQQAMRTKQVAQRERKLRRVLSEG